jgi:hypothetical protein
MQAQRDEDPGELVSRVARRSAAKANAVMSSEVEDTMVAEILSNFSNPMPRRRHGPKDTLHGSGLDHGIVSAQAPRISTRRWAGQHSPDGARQGGVWQWIVATGMARDPPH